MGRETTEIPPQSQENTQPATRSQLQCTQVSCERCTRKLTRIQPETEEPKKKAYAILFVLIRQERQRDSARAPGTRSLEHTSRATAQVLRCGCRQFGLERREKGEEGKIE